jgi:hypothetical protein
VPRWQVQDRHGRGHPSAKRRVRQGMCGGHGQAPRIGLLGATRLGSVQRGRAHVVPAPTDCGERASMRGGGRQVGLQRVHGGGRSLADSWAQGRFNKPYFL